MNVGENAMQNGILGRTAVDIWCQKPQIAPQMFPFSIFPLFPTVCVHSFPAPILDFYMNPARYFEACQSLDPFYWIWLCIETSSAYFRSGIPQVMFQFS